MAIFHSHVSHYQRLHFQSPLLPGHIVGIWTTDGVLATGTGGALLDALRGEARGLAVLVVVRHQALRLGRLGRGRQQGI